jgi:L-iditol 2-dehydrogenase
MVNSIPIDNEPIVWRNRWEIAMLALMKLGPGRGNLELREIEEPSPQKDQVMVEVQAAGLCASDLHIRDWDIQLKLRPPVVIGHEFAGKIAALGRGVENLRIGQRVTSETAFYVCGHCIPCRNGEYNACADKELIGYVHDGCFTKYVVVPVERIHPLPENVSTLDAALCEPLACVTMAVLELTNISPGDLVVVAGPGPIGLLASQVALSAGAKVVVCGIDGDENRLKIAEKLGVLKTVNAAKEDLRSVIREIGHDEGADVYLECAGSPSAVRAGLKVVRRRGQFTLIGLSAAPFELDFSLIAYKEIVVRGSLGQKWSSWKRALHLLSTGQVKTGPLITHEFPLTEWENAFAAFEEQREIKVVLHP